MKDAVLLIAISLATIILTIALNLNLLAAIPGALGLAIGTILVRLNRAPAPAGLASRSDGWNGNHLPLDRSTAA